MRMAVYLNILNAHVTKVHRPLVSYNSTFQTYTTQNFRTCTPKGCKYIHTYIHLHTSYAYLLIHTPTHMICMHTYIHTYIHKRRFNDYNHCDLTTMAGSYTHIHMHTYIHTHIHTPTHILCMHTYIHTYIYKRRFNDYNHCDLTTMAGSMRCIHTYIHTYIHI